MRVQVPPRVQRAEVYASAFLLFKMLLRWLPPRIGIKAHSFMIGLFLFNVTKAKINKNITPHLFKHSYATHLQESGIDMRYIQIMFGHSSIKTTETYAHVSSQNIQAVISPIAEIQLL